MWRSCLFFDCCCCSRLCPVPAVRFIPKLLGCRPLVNLSQPHSGLLLAHLLRAMLEWKSSAMAVKDVQEARRRQWELLLFKEAGAFRLLAERTFPSRIRKLELVEGQTLETAAEVISPAAENGKTAVDRNPNAWLVLARLVHVLNCTTSRASPNPPWRRQHPSCPQRPCVFCRSPSFYPSLPRLFRAIPALHTFRRYVQRRISAANADCASSVRRRPSRAGKIPDSSSRLVRLPLVKGALSVGRKSTARLCQLSRSQTGGLPQRRKVSNRDSSFNTDRATSAGRPNLPLIQSPAPSLSNFPQPSPIHRRVRSRSSSPHGSPLSSLSLNSLLSPVRSALAALCRSHPAVLGCSVLSFTDVHRQLLAWWRKHLSLIAQVENILNRYGPRAGVARVTLPRMYFVVGDLQTCYEHISHADLLEAMQRRISKTGVETLHVMKLYRRVVAPSISPDGSCKGPPLSRHEYSSRGTALQRPNRRTEVRYRVSSRPHVDEGCMSDLAQEAERSEKAFLGSERTAGNNVLSPPVEGAPEKMCLQEEASGNAGKNESTRGYQQVRTRKRKRHPRPPAAGQLDQSEREIEDWRCKAQNGTGTQPPGTAGNTSARPAVYTPLARSEACQVDCYTQKLFSTSTKARQGAATTGQIEEIGVPSLQGRHPLLGTLLRRQGQQRKKAEPLEVQRGPTCACLCTDEKRKHTYLLPGGPCPGASCSTGVGCPGTKLAKRRCITESSRQHTPPTASGSPDRDPPCSSLSPCFALPARPSGATTESSSLTNSSACATVHGASRLLRSASRVAEAVFRARLLRGCAPGGAVLLTEVGQPMVLHAEEILLVVKLFLLQHRVRFSKRAACALEDGASPSPTKQRQDRETDNCKPGTRETEENGRAVEAAASQREPSTTGGSRGGAGQQTAVRAEGAADRSRSVRRKCADPSQLAWTCRKANDQKQMSTYPRGHDFEGNTAQQLSMLTLVQPSTADALLQSAVASSRHQRTLTGRQRVGIPQGSSISGFLCALYYADRDSRPEVQALLRGETVEGLGARSDAHRAELGGLRKRGEIHPPRANSVAGQNSAVSSASFVEVRASNTPQSRRRERSCRVLLQNTQLWPREKESQAQWVSALSQDQEKSGEMGNGCTGFLSRVQGIPATTGVRDTSVAKKCPAKRIISVGPLAIEFGTWQSQAECRNSFSVSCGSSENNGHEGVSEGERREKFGNRIGRRTSQEYDDETKARYGKACSGDTGRRGLPERSSCPADRVDCSSLALSAAPPRYASSASACRARRRLLRALERLVWPPLLVRWVDDFLFFTPSRASAEFFLRLLLRHHIWGANVNERKLKSNLFDHLPENVQQAGGSPLALSGTGLSTPPGSSRSLGDFSKFLRTVESISSWRKPSSCRSLSAHCYRDMGGGMGLARRTAFYTGDQVEVRRQRRRERRKRKLQEQPGTCTGTGGVREQSTRRRKLEMIRRQDLDCTLPIVSDRSVAEPDAVVLPRPPGVEPIQAAAAIDSLPSISNSTCFADSRVDAGCSSAFLHHSDTRTVSNASPVLPPATSSLSALPVGLATQSGVSSRRLGPCWAGVRISFDIQNRGLCILPLLRRDVPDEVEQMPHAHTPVDRTRGSKAQQATRCGGLYTLTYSGPRNGRQKGTDDKSHCESGTYGGVVEASKKKLKKVPRRHGGECTAKAPTTIRDSLSLRQNVFRRVRTSAAHKASFMKVGWADSVPSSSHGFSTGVESLFHRPLGLLSK